MKVSEIKKYKENNYGALSRDLAEFEKNFMLISTGILAFTITFIKDLIKIESTTSLNLLYLGWTLISISITLIMISFLESARASNKLWKCVDDFYLEKLKFEAEDKYSDTETIEIKSKTNKILFQSKKSLYIIRIFAILSFVFGLFSIAIFVGKNMENEINRIKKIENAQLNKSDSLLQIINNKQKEYKKKN